MSSTNATADIWATPRSHSRVYLSKDASVASPASPHTELPPTQQATQQQQQGPGSGPWEEVTSKCQPMTPWLSQNRLNQQ